LEIHGLTNQTQEENNGESIEEDEKGEEDIRV
jgi:hypothetical protein